MEPKKVYLVWGFTGEYDDKQEWIVCGYLDEQSAKDHAAAAQLEANRIANSGNLIWSPNRNKYDPDFQFQVITGTEYSVGYVEVRDGFELIEDKEAEELDGRAKCL